MNENNSISNESNDDTNETISFKKSHLTPTNNFQNNSNNMNFHSPDHFHKPQQSLIRKFINILEKIDEALNEIIGNSTSAFDLMIAHSDFSFIARKILHSKTILLVIYILNTHYLLSNIEHQNKISIIYYISFISLVIAYFSFHILNYFNNFLFLDKDIEIEEFALKRNPLLSRNMCEECKTIKCVRSVHCEYCRKCIIKYNFHSDWFNICIGASNEFLYTMVVAIIIFYFLVSFVIMLYDNFINYDKNDFLLQIQLWLVVTFYVLFKSLIFYKKFIFTLLDNLTFYERKMSRSLSYLFYDYRREFYNPFDKGKLSNFKEVIQNCFLFISSSNSNRELINEKIEIINEIEENQNKKIVEQNKNFNQLNPNSKQGQIETFKIFLELEKPFDEFISSRGLVIKKINGKNIVNWSTLRIYNIFEIENSPFKNIMIMQAKNYLKNYGII